MRPSDSEVLEAITGTHLLGDLEHADLVALADRFEVVDASRGEWIMREGEGADVFCLVLAGAFEVSVSRANGETSLLGVMRRGEYFGEIALLERSVRSASVRARSVGRLARLRREDFQDFVAAHPRIEQVLLAGLRMRTAWSGANRHRPPGERVLEMLRSFFPEIDEAMLRAIEPELEWVALPRGTTFIRQGEVGDCLYLVVSGRVAASITDPSGNEVVVGESGEGEIVGEMALLSSSPRSATVATTRETTLLRISAVGFEQLVARHPRAFGVVARAIVEKMSQRARTHAVVAEVRGRQLVSPAECEQVTHTPNLVLRNLRITQMYHRLSQELALVIGHEDANWCTFACNASKTAGYAIRREDLPLFGTVSLLRRDERVATVGRWAWELLDRASVQRHFDEVLDAVSVAISAGNLKVYSELAPIFARFVSSLHRARGPDPGGLAECLADLAPGATETGGQDLLAEAFRHYHDAAFEASPKRRAELVLLANCKVGLHEQIRLQPHIAQAMEAPLHAGFPRLIRQAVSERLPGFASSLVQGAESRLTVVAAQWWRRLLTETMLTIRLPYGRLRLGDDLPLLPHQRAHADMLHTLDHPELRRFVERFDRSRSGSRGSRARDWGDLDQRMNFIVNLFRSRQKSLELFDQPFLYEQRTLIDVGAVPGGPL